MTKPFGKWRVPFHWVDETSEKSGTKFGLVGNPFAKSPGRSDGAGCTPQDNAAGGASAAKKMANHLSKEPFTH